MHIFLFVDIVLSHHHSDRSDKTSQNTQNTQTQNFRISEVSKNLRTFRISSTSEFRISKKIPKLPKLPKFPKFQNFRNFRNFRNFQNFQNFRTVYRIWIAPPRFRSFVFSFFRSFVRSFVRSFFRSFCVLRSFVRSLLRFVAFVDRNPVYNSVWALGFALTVSSFTVAFDCGTVQCGDENECDACLLGCWLVGWLVGWFAVTPRRRGGKCSLRCAPKIHVAALFGRSNPAWNENATANPRASVSEYQRV